MPYRVIVFPPVMRLVGQCGLGREATLWLWNRLFDQLENHADRYRSERVPEDTDLFQYPLLVLDGEWWHYFYFSVDDRQAPAGPLLVIAVSHIGERV
jgi:hypothetical protein